MRSRRTRPGWMLALACACGSSPDTLPSTGVELPEDGGRLIAGCPSMPADHAWNVAVEGLPARADSERRMAFLDRSVPGGLRAGACATVWEGSRCGLPWTLADEDSPWRRVRFAGPWVWGEADVPLPADYRIEGEPNPAGAWDRHVLVVDAPTCTLHELINLRRSPLGLFADGLARWDLRSNDRAFEEFAGAEAAGLPMVPGIYSFEEVEQGEIRHALRIVLPVVQDRFVWPADHTDGRSADPDAVPMGARLRLRADVDLDGLGPQARVIAEALRRYGAWVADSTVSQWHLSGVPDSRWDDEDLATLERLRPADLEWVDLQGWAREEASLRAGP